ncbi:MAG: hypothetical protein J6T31_02600 [Methanobrevibacter sp.]|nr:hypothetical protein [Methanobrevibacter sp.]
MKAINVLCIAALALFLGSCSKDDDATKKTIKWDSNFCNSVSAYVDMRGQIVKANNSKDGIFVDFNGEEKLDGMNEGVIYLYVPTSDLVFMSNAGNFKKIEIFELYPDYYTVAPDGWTWNEDNSSYIWQGTPAQYVNMRGIADEEIKINVEKILFTLE